MAKGLEDEFMKDVIFRLNLKGDKEPTMEVVRGIALPKAGAACAKVLSWEREEAGKFRS